MTPSLLPDDLVLVRHNSAVATGDVVLARFQSRPELTVVKRAAAQTGAGWTVVSDNAAGVDSTTYGPAEVLAVARWVVPGKTRRRLAAAGAFADDRSRLGRLAERLPRRVASKELS